MYRPVGDGEEDGSMARDKRAPNDEAVTKDAASHPRLVAISAEPWNAETLLPEHVGTITPNASFYKRNHFPIPQLTASQWRLTVAGAVTAPLALSYDELWELPSRTL